MSIQARRPRPTPQSGTFSRLTTKSVEARDRFDFWRHLFVASDVEMPDPGASDFRGELFGCADHDGIVFANLRADPIICSFGRRDSDLVLLGYLRYGTLRIRHGGDQADVVSAGSGLVLFDCDRSAVTSSSPYEMSYLALPRPLVVAAMGGDPVPDGKALLRLPSGGLATILQSHLRSMAEAGSQLDAVETAAAMQASSTLAIALLAGIRHRPPEQSETLDSSLFAAARRYIEGNLGNPALTADQVADSLGCSRAHLYRIFAARGQTVAGCLRDLRLQRARRLIETQVDEPIGMIAFNCGYTDLSAFGKAFRRCFGLTPSDCRLLACAWPRASSPLAQ